MDGSTGWYWRINRPVDREAWVTVGVERRYVCVLGKNCLPLPEACKFRDSTIPGRSWLAVIPLGRVGVEAAGIVWGFNHC